MRIGDTIGAYRVLAKLGEGGMGEVYRATDTKLKRQVAIKVLPASVAADAERLARFQREAEVLAALNHPNIAAIYGLEVADGIKALVMELVEGPTLADRIAQGAIPFDEALPIARQMAEALEAAHEQGIVHRDLKPANIKLRPDGVVKVLDFGLAKAMEPTGTVRPDATNLPTLSLAATQAGMILGTAAYMSPEQARGKPVDKRTDIWAFGCVLYEMLTGRRAFDGEDIAVTLARVVEREPDFDAIPASVPARARQTLRLCLRKDPKQRVSDIRDVRLALEGAFDPAPPDAVRSGAIAQPVWRRALPVAVAAGVAVLITSFAAWSVWPSAAPQAVNRFEYGLPPDHTFRNSGRPVMALSPDGRYFVYNTAKGLYLRAMDALDARLILGTEGGSLSSPFFSPDGESVGYFETGSLKRIRISGGAAVVICAATTPFGVHWGADDSILFGQPKGIMRVSANGGTPELVIPAKEGEQVDGPQLLPDGDSVLFSVTTAIGATRWDQAQIVVQSIRTGQRKTVLPGGSDARYVPTGHLIYALGEALFAVAFDVTRLEVRGGPVSMVEGVTRAINLAVTTGTANYGVSGEGRLVYLNGLGAGFGARTVSGTLVWVDRRGREEPLGAPARRYIYSRLSPDGTRVALDIDDDNRDIWVWDLRRQTMTRMTFDPQLDALPVWSPDGRRLVWDSQRAGQALNLYWQAADGTGMVERLTEGPNSQRPSSFTPDGQRLLLMESRAEQQASQDLGMLPLEGDRRVTWLVRTMFSELNGEISPDGRWLAYQSDESGQFEIYVRPFPAVDQGRWQVSTTGGRQPLWARSGRELFYVAPDGALVGVPVEVAPGGASFGAGAPVTVVQGAGYNDATGTPNLGRTYDVSPDGARFLRIKVQEDGADNGGPPTGIVVVLNWFEELTQRVPAGQ